MKTPEKVIGGPPPPAGEPTGGNLFFRSIDFAGFTVLDSVWSCFWNKAHAKWGHVTANQCGRFNAVLPSG